MKSDNSPIVRTANTKNGEADSLHQQALLFTICLSSFAKSDMTYRTEIEKLLYVSKHLHASSPLMAGFAYKDMYIKLSLE